MTINEESEEEMKEKKNSIANQNSAESLTEMNMIKLKQMARRSSKLVNR